MTEHERPVMKGRKWILDRSGVLLLVLLMALAGLVQPLARVNAALPASLVFAAYLCWLLLVFSKLRDHGRSWARSWLAWAPFVVLFCFALLVVPLQSVHRHSMIGLAELNPFLSAVAGLSYLAVWDHLALSLARRRASPSQGFSRYVGTLLLSFMPPFAVLWVQHHIRANEEQ